MSKHAFYVGEMLRLCMVIFHHGQSRFIIHMQSVLTKEGDAEKGGGGAFSKGTRREWKKKTVANYSLGSYKEPRVEIKTWLLLSFHAEMSQTRQGEEERGGGCQWWKWRFVPELTQWLCDLQIKHLELFCGGKKRQKQKPARAPESPAIPRSLHPPNPAPPALQPPRLYIYVPLNPSIPQNVNAPSLFFDTSDDSSSAFIHMVIAEPACVFVYMCVCVCVDASVFVRRKKKVTHRTPSPLSLHGKSVSTQLSLA